jgi:catechol 2,3-dioxygenase-like lactoylglutathione lyase family enzyme
MAMPISDVTVVSVPVSGQDRAKRFYTEALGFQLLRDDESVPGMRWAQVAPPGGTALTLVTWFDTMPPGSLRSLVLASSGLAADYQRLRDLGVEFDQAPVQQPWATEAVLRDPDGNQLVLRRPNERHHDRVAQIREPPWDSRHLAAARSRPGGGIGVSHQRAKGMTKGNRMASGKHSVGRRTAPAILAEAATFATASMIHFGTGFTDAAIPELVIAVALALGGSWVLSRRRRAWGISVGTVAFATFGTIVGLTIIATSRQDVPDLTYHASILAALAVTLTALVRSGAAGPGR